MFNSAPPHGNCLAARLWPAAVSLVLAPGISSHGMIPVSRETHAPDTRGVALPRVLWVRVDPLRPHILFASGFGYCHASSSPSGASQICPPWLMRSRDGGATWQDLGGLLPGFTIGQTHLSPPIFAPDGRHLYLPSSDAGLSLDSGGSGYFVSSDGGSSWQGNWSLSDYQGGITGLTMSPASPRRFYAIFKREGIDHLPVSMSSIMDIDAGRRAGDPVYLLARGAHNGVEMQWFEKVRLEWRPEAGGTVLLGLLGSESLYIHGWLPPRGNTGSFYWST